MDIQTSLLVALSSLGLLAGLVALVLAKRLVRRFAERRSRRRQTGWVTALGTGPVPDMRMRQLRRLACETARRSAAQNDLLWLLDAPRLSPRDSRRAPFERALRRSELLSALR